MEQVVFLWLGVGALLLLLLAGILDGALEGLDFHFLDQGWFNVMGLLAALGLFGFTTYLMESLLQQSLLLALLVGGGVGAAGGLLVGSTTAFLRDSSQEEGIWSESVLLGKEGRIIMGAQAEGLGTVSIERNGLLEHLTAQSPVALQEGMRVRVVEVVSHTLVRVEPLQALEAS